MTLAPHPLAVHKGAGPVFSSHCPENASQVDTGPCSSLRGLHEAHVLSGPSPYLHRAADPAHFKIIPKVQGSQLENQCMCALMLGPDDLSPNNKYLCVRMLESPQHTKTKREPALAGLRPNHKMVV